CVKGFFEMESEIELLRRENARLVAKITGLEMDTVADNVRRDDEIAELKAEVVKLRDGNEGKLPRLLIYLAPL
ncbi:24176_t:CDS:2, partial [Dentiscutata erythropus]